MSAKDSEAAFSEKGRVYATGKRKSAVARVWIKPGSGKITINGKPDSKYFGRTSLQLMVRQSFGALGRENQYDVQCTVHGGGLSGQAGALHHGIARCLAKDVDESAKTLRAAGFLTRDTRIVERKKYGRRKARRGFQFSKR